MAKVWDIIRVWQQETPCHEHGLFNEDHRDLLFYCECDKIATPDDVTEEMIFEASHTRMPASVLNYSIAVLDVSEMEWSN